MEKSEPAGVSRRALLGAAGGAAIGAVLTGASPARAADGDPLIIGVENTGNQTFLTSSGPALMIIGGGDDVSLRVRNSEPQTGSAIEAEGGYTTMYVRDGEVGIDAFGRVTGVGALGLVTGVWGQSPHRVGVRGEGGAVGVSGVSTNGVGVKAQAGKAGVALSVKGRSQFTTAGMTTIPQGDSSAAVTSPVPLSQGSLILATPQSAGGAIESASKDIAGGTFTLTLVEPASQPVDVAWFVIG